jgi:hypothetical protein
VNACAHDPQQSHGAGARPSVTDAVIHYDHKGDRDAVRESNTCGENVVIPNAGEPGRSHLEPTDGKISSQFLRRA